MWTRPLAVLIALAGPAAAQEPLSAIDWLGRDRSEPAIAPRAGTATGSSSTLPEREEPPAVRDARAPEVETGPIGAPEAGAAGLLPMAVTGLPRTLWEGSDPARLQSLISQADPAVPALAALLNTLMLAEADPPPGANNFLAVRVARLVETGALDAAEALLERAGPARPGLFPLWFDVALLTGDASAPCAALNDNPVLARDVGPRVFCAARDGDWPRAALTFETARALGELSGRDADLIERFLSPEMAEETPPLPPPPAPTALQFALAEAVGEPLPAGALPRAFAVAALSGDRGWKAQLDAAERLVRAGALSENRLLGIYTLREPAASGGVWDRVEAVQALDRALAGSDPDALAGALSTAWREMRASGLAVPFSRLFGPDLARRDLSGAAGRIAAQAALLSDSYEDAAATITTDTPELRFLMAVARGSDPSPSPDLPHARAIAAAFAENRAPAGPLIAIAQEDRLGEAILRTMALFSSGAAGNAGDLTDALATLRALGLEDTARRAALQLAILSEDVR
ncbi:hypothetical protein ROJ8625_01435 [Roseivivax jejudonensis]|uniref:Antifreeze glycopeptide polyprotein n=1 Tax=Roseivivax jejudonensis TaxID=1529041 RepID=A0A1X6YUW3_9RHOB|nr:hypothetical protein [Roseivivax jejudonensis]SLN31616.1 hypothetical protein ROJ8625_01435 [Roseivivax jejudonensis]